MKVCNIDTLYCICVWCINQGVQSKNFAALYFEKLLFDGQECSIPWPQWRFGTLLEWNKNVQILVFHYAAKICNVCEAYWIDNISVFMILSLNRSLPLVPYEGILAAQSKSYIAYLSYQMWFVCKAIPLRIYQISHINFLPFSWNSSFCVLCYCHNVNFFSSNGSLSLMLCLLLDHFRGDMIDFENWMSLVSISIIFYGTYYIYHIDVLWAIMIKFPVL